MNNEYEIIIAKSKLTFDLPNWFLRFLEEYAEKMLYERLADISNSLRRTEYETRLVPFITMENLVMPYSPLTGTFFRGHAWRSSGLTLTHRFMYQKKTSCVSGIVSWSSRETIGTQPIRLTV